jgi:hypothetical protein
MTAVMAPPVAEIGEIPPEITTFPLAHRLH